MTSVHSTNVSLLVLVNYKSCVVCLCFSMGMDALKVQFKRITHLQNRSGKDGSVVRGSGLSEGKSSCGLSDLLPKFEYFKLIRISFTSV
jgi:hypothetical protein